MGYSVTEYNKRGIDCAKLKDYEMAVFYFEKAIELDKNNAILYFNIGLAYSESKNYSQAILNYSKAIELNPNYEDAYYNRGIVYRRRAVKPFS